MYTSHVFDMNLLKKIDATSLKKRPFNDFFICSVYLCCLLSLFFPCLYKCLWLSSIESPCCCCVFHSSPCLAQKILPRLLVFTKVNKEDPFVRADSGSIQRMFPSGAALKAAAAESYMVSGVKLALKSLKELDPLLLK